MGFRDLRSFNLAMLGKQIWRVIHYPDSLLSRVFKAKYFPNTHILQASPKGNSSFTWKSICNAMDLVKSGVYWRVGNGTSINLWSDSWIPRDSGFKPFTPNLLGLMIVLWLLCLRMIGWVGMWIWFVAFSGTLTLSLFCKSLCPPMMLLID